MAWRNTRRKYNLLSFGIPFGGWAVGVLPAVVFCRWLGFLAFR